MLLTTCYPPLVSYFLGVVVVSGGKEMVIYLPHHYFTHSRGDSCQRVTLAVLVASAGVGPGRWGAIWPPSSYPTPLAKYFFKMYLKLMNTPISLWQVQSMVIMLVQQLYTAQYILLGSEGARYCFWKCNGEQHILDSNIHIFTLNCTSGFIWNCYPNYA